MYARKKRPSLGRLLSFGRTRLRTAALRGCNSFSECIQGRALRPELRRLQASDGELLGLNREIERRFISCGSALHNQLGLIRRLTEENRRLLAVDDRRRAGETAAARVAARLDFQLDLTQAFAAQIQHLIRSLEAYDTRLTTLLSDQDELERSFAPLRILERLFRIESAALPSDMRDLFNAVTVEMARLDEDVRSSFDAQREALLETRQRVAGTLQSLRAQTTAQREAVQLARQTSTDCLAALSAELGRSGERDHLLQESITDINRQIDAMVVSLQYQDITKQQIDHILAALRDVVQPGPDADGVPYSLARRARPSLNLCRIQGRQLEAVHTELSAAANQLSSGLRAVMLRLQSIHDDCLSVEKLQQTNERLDALTDTVLAQYSRTERCMDEALSSLRDATEATRAFAQATVGATDTMRRLAAEIRLMGLNAIVQSVQVNRGGLEVLSTAAHSISSVAGALIETFQRNLHAATRSLAEIVRESEAYLVDNTRQHEATLEENRRLGAEVQQEHAANKATLAGINGLLQSLKQAADELLESIDLAEFSREPLLRAAAQFEAVAAQWARIPTRGDPAHDAPLPSLHARYTMESERRIHEQATSIASVPPSTGVAVNAAVAASSVELFSDPTPDSPPPSGDQPAAAPANLGDNVELF